MTQFSASDLGKLTGQRKTVVEYVFIERKTTAHACKRWGMTEGAIKRIVQLARRDLKRQGVALPDRRRRVAVRHKHRHSYGKYGT